MNSGHVDSITGILSATRQKLVRYYSRMHELERLVVHQIQTDLMRRHRKRWRHSQPELAYCTLILALQQHYQVAHVTKLQNVSLDEIRQVEKKQINATIAQRKKSRRGSKREMLIHQVQYIQQLRKEGLSWRETASFVGERIGTPIAHSYLKKIVEQNIQLQPKGRAPALAAPEKPKY